jgi:hypothetical protein
MLKSEVSHFAQQGSDTAADVENLGPEAADASQT